MVNISAERIILMDKILNQMVDHFVRHKDKRNPCPTLYTEIFEIPQELSEFLFNMLSQIGENNSLLVSQKFGDGSYGIVRINSIECEDFISQGGFSKYFQRVSNKHEMQQVIVLNIGEKNIIAVGNENNIGMVEKKD